MRGKRPSPFRPSEAGLARCGGNGPGPIPIRRRGESLLELLTAVALFLGVVVVFAAVFPTAYRLNRSNLIESKATHFSRAIVEEMESMPYSDLELMPATAVGGGWPLNSRFDQFPRAVDGSQVIRTTFPFPRKTGVYFLPTAASLPDVEMGMKVTAEDGHLPSFVDSTSPLMEPPLRIASMEINLYFYENRKGKLILRRQHSFELRPSNVLNQRGY